MKTIYLHIGTPKTGTTNIQAYLAHNRARLLDEGVCYLADKQGVTAHGVALALGCMEAHPPDAHHEDLQWFCDQLRTALASPAERIVISSEMFCEVLGYRRLGMLKRLHATLIGAGPARIVVVCYLRRQDLFVESRQAHDIVHCGAGHPVTTIDPEMIISYADYYHLLSDCREVFGRDILVRPFERRQLLNGDVLDDFLNVIGVAQKPGDTQPSAQEQNTKLRGDLVELMRLYNASTLAERHDPLARPWPFLPGLFTPQQSRSGPGTRFLTLDKARRAAILKRYAASNRKVAIEFLGRKDGKLFRDPVVSKCADANIGSALQIEEAAPLLMHMIAGVFAHSEWLKVRLTAAETSGRQMWQHSCALEQKLRTAETRLDARLTRLSSTEARTASLESQLREANQRCERLEREQRELGWQLACRSIEGKKLIGWGAGTAFRADYSRNPVRLAYVVDNDRKKWGQRLQGTTIASPSSLEREDPADVVIVVYSAFFEVIAAQIAGYGRFTVIPSDAFAKYAASAAGLAKPAKARRRYADTAAPLALATASDS